MMTLRFALNGPASRCRSAAMTAVAVCVLLTAAGCGKRSPPTPAPTPTPTASTPVVHDVSIVTDPVVCGQKDCVCATPNLFKAGRGDIVRWINATSAKVTITPSKSDTFVGSTGAAGSVGVDMLKTRPTTISSSLNVGDIIQMTLALEGELSLCQGYLGPRMEIDN